jgi:hypothetical protein
VPVLYAIMQRTPRKRAVHIQRVAMGRRHLHAARIVDFWKTLVPGESQIATSSCGRVA